MKKFFAAIVKFLVVLSVIAGIACAVIRYWDSIIEFADKVKSLWKGRKRVASADETDFADWVD